MPRDGKIAIFGNVLEGVPRSIMGLAALLVVSAGLYATVVKPKTVSDGTLRLLDEYQRHAAEEPEMRVALRQTAQGKLSAALFHDGCLQPLWTPTVGQPRSTIIMPLWSDPDIPTAFSYWPFEAVVSAATACDQVRHGAVVREQDERRGNWLYRHRFYAEGCHSVQAYDVEHRVLYAITWIICRH